MRRLLSALLLALPWILAHATSEAETALRPRFEPTAPDVVRAMLDLAQIGPADVVYDLGCGDGRIVIEALKRGAARAVCVDIDPRRIAEARSNARREALEERIAFRTEDVLHTPLEGATVVTMFLSRDLNLALRPRLQRELPKGARVVSHWHAMGDWTPERTVHINAFSRSHPVYLWTLR